MLVLSRRLGQRIHIGDDVFVTLLAVNGKAVRLGIDAPPEVPIRRQELDDRARHDDNIRSHAGFRRRRAR